MVMRSARFWYSSVAGGCVCGLLLAVTPAAAQVQSVQEKVQQSMEAGEAAIDEAAATAEEPAGQPPVEPSESSVIDIRPLPSSEEAAGEPAMAEPAGELPSAEPGELMVPSVSEGAPAEAAPAVAEAEPPPPSSYTVQSGDTLWSISVTFLSDPFYWPRLWDVNPLITNPDLIFPGNVLTLPGRAPVAVAEAEPAPPAVEEAPAEVAEAVEEPASPPAVEEAPQEEAPLLAEEEAAELFAEKPPAFEVLPPPPTQSKEILAFSSGYIARSVPVAGRVVGTHENRVLLGEHDRIYLLSEGEALEPQGSYTIYRRTKKVVHPVTNRVVGDLIKILGEVEVEQVDSVSTGSIVRSYAFIQPGDLIMPTHLIEAAPMPPVVEQSDEALSGWVLEVTEQRTLTAQFDVVYIDRGERAGVVAGDRFRIFREGQRTPSYAMVPNVRLPDHLIGELEVLSVQAETATALLISGNDLVSPGDRIER
jgi:LysM repeat protein